MCTALRTQHERGPDCLLWRGTVVTKQTVTCSFSPVLNPEGSERKENYFAESELAGSENNNYRIFPLIRVFGRKGYIAGIYTHIFFFFKVQFSLDGWKRKGEENYRKRTWTQLQWGKKIHKRTLKSLRDWFLLRMPYLSLAFVLDFSRRMSTATESYPNILSHSRIRSLPSHV